MTLDECIVDCEQVMFGAQTMKQTEAYNYHRQLAEWLRELKDYRERIPSYEAGYNDAKREIALSGEYERAYQRGYMKAMEDRTNKLKDINKQTEVNADENIHS